MLRGREGGLDREGHDGCFLGLVLLAVSYRFMGSADYWCLVVIEGDMLCQADEACVGLPHVRMRSR